MGLLAVLCANRFDACERHELNTTLVRNPDLQQAQVHNPDLAVGA